MSVLIKPCTKHQYSSYLVTAKKLLTKSLKRIYIYRERERERELSLKFYCLQLTSPQDKGVQNMINFPPRTATCTNHVVLSKGISSMDNKDESSASAEYRAMPAEIFTFNRFVYMYIIICIYMYSHLSLSIH